ncbi:hypothetical protein LB566_27125 [Mesorhizobium sp. CA13]|uniref:DUF6894 family protein n=1 Tax=unclassified Mesorhizobium TaxID=325217 RepID=UPI00112BB587|nr:MULTISPECIES: hypothetical protein [unclassified Mesorhizobium]MBZ9811217.1 hypothetical protein [Mesorhizobium sp. ESP-6-2]MBZ9857463.1 hypothetical protein [Mesorhizobium sp. CA13]MBZ9870231.1 hypothetical protein [Mesorhizobium sp. BR1-1-9]MBZ9922063.1 hypothetical protein [Mesorhizobium sp. BR1-1-7]MBZ9942193.1 hypothetical protein [Mesorhizobium sp. BR1-1-13]
MPRFFFDTIEDGQITPDDQGLEMSVSDMREAAKHLLPELAINHPLPANRHEFVVRVRDENGQHIYEVKLTLAARSRLVSI